MPHAPQSKRESHKTEQGNASWHLSSWIWQLRSMPVTQKAAYGVAPLLAGGGGACAPCPRPWWLLRGRCYEVDSSAIAPESPKTGPNRVVTPLKAIHTVGQNSLHFLFSISNNVALNALYYSLEILPWTSVKSLTSPNTAKPGTPKKPKS